MLIKTTQELGLRTTDKVTITFLAITTDMQVVLRTKTSGQP